MKFIGAFFILWTFMLGVACEEKKANRESPPEIPRSEIERGVKACRSYVARLCECGKNDEEYKLLCEKNSSKVEALKIYDKVLRESREGKMEADSKSQMKIYQEVYILINHCFSEQVKIDVQRCPVKSR